MVTVRTHIFPSSNADHDNGSCQEPMVRPNQADSSLASINEGHSVHPRAHRDELYEEFAPLVRRLLRQYGSDAELRRDLSGEIYCLFCGFVEAFDPTRGVPFRPYIVRQLTASVYTYVRREWTRNSRELSDNGTEDSSSAKRGHDPTAAWIAKLSEQQVLNTLPTAIAQLPDRQRKVLLWRYYDELPFEEIASLLHVEASTCRSLLRHALNNLRKQMMTRDCADASNSDI
jgi:RNA polymerase sigma factor (sigma-70 family)